jgi:hypothetical protein
MRTCIHPKGFLFGIHKPSYRVRNLRTRTRTTSLGSTPEGEILTNEGNYPESDISVATADWIYEIANPFPFRGTTYVDKKRADQNALDPSWIRLPVQNDMSFTGSLASLDISPNLTEKLPRPVLLCIATSSTDPEDLVRLAHLSAAFSNASPEGRIELRFKESNSGPARPEIFDHDLFEAVDNPFLPDNYKVAMVIRPGAQGVSEIVGDFHEEATHVYEYLRRNSYIGGGHYAANMAEDAIRYDIDHLGRTDMTGLRQLYYQRSYVRLADELGIDCDPGALDADGLESLRKQIVDHPGLDNLAIAATLWGWNFGFDFSPTGYRLHASHQQIHQQYAMIPTAFSSYLNGEQTKGSALRPFSAGDMVHEAIAEYETLHGSRLFKDYFKALYSNRRMDHREDLESSLVIWENDQALLFVPKAQVSQWELQVMTKPGNGGYWPGNVLETDRFYRGALDTALLLAQKVLASLGARLVTSIELGKRFQARSVQQPLIYSLMPKIPYSPGSLSETQYRFINGHYPEDFAAACRGCLKDGSKDHAENE